MGDPLASTPPRFVVLAPTFDNAATLLAVLAGVEALGLPVVVIDDGATDGTAALLTDWADARLGRHVVTHDHNRGKAAALQTGFVTARRLGYTHAATIDTDAQHDPADLPRLIQQAQQRPGAIVVGIRSINTAGYPMRSRLGRRASNAMVRLLGGTRVADSQCGLRVYPLDALEFLACRSGRYAFETEVLVRAGWAHVDLAEVPVRCIYHTGGERVSHFKPWRDSFSAALMHSGLLLRSLWLVPTRKYRPTDCRTHTGTIVERLLRWLNPWPNLRALRRDGIERERFARGVGVGAFVAMLPPMGFKTFACLAAAKTFGLQPTVTLAVSSLQTPPIGIPLALLSIHTGHLLLTGGFAGTDVLDTGRGWAGMVGFIAACWALGGLVSGTLIGLATYAITRAKTPTPQTSRANEGAA